MCSQATPRERSAITRRRWVIAAALALALCGVASPSAAADADFHVGLRFDVSGTARRCWDEADFRRSVAGRIGYDPFRDGATPVVSIQIGGSARAVDGRVEWRDAGGASLGEHKFVARDGDCQRLLQEMSFAVGLQLELLRPKTPPPGPVATPEPASTAAPVARATIATVSSSTSTSSPTTAPLPSTPPAPPPAAPIDAHKEDRPARKTIATDVDEPSSRWPMWLGVGPALGLGIAPSLTGTARLFIAARRHDRSVELGAEASYPTTERQWDGTGFRQGLIGVSAAFCGHRHVLSACVLAKASQVRVSGLGVDNPRSPTGVAVQVGVRGGATLPLGGPWSATAHLDALGLLTPYTVDLDQTAVWEMPRLGALAGIDISARFR